MLFLQPFNFSMIQRIQSVYLFLSAVALFCFGLFPLAELHNPQTQDYVSLGGPSALNTFIPALVSSLISISAIFLYRNRKAQMRLCLVLLVLSIVLSGGSAYGIVQQAGALSAEVSWKFGLFFPLLAVAFLLLAWRGVRSDDQLIRSADRLR